VELAKFERSLERHFYHTKCLEILLRRLENDDVTVEELEEIKDSVDYYVESNQVSSPLPPLSLSSSFVLGFLFPTLSLSRIAAGGGVLGGRRDLRPL
jgi:hypothetical protein